MSEATTEEATQSRVGKRPVQLPAGVSVKVDGRNVSVKGPKGELSRSLPATVELKVDGSVVTVGMTPDAGRDGKQFQGLARALLAGMVEGTANGFNRSLDLKGVGYRAELKGQTLTMALGLSHQVVYKLPDAVSAKVEIIDEGGIKTPRVHLSSYDKEALGQAAARMRAFRPPEPYTGKGVRYTGERIREKAGKAGGKK